MKMENEKFQMKIQGANFYFYFFCEFYFEFHLFRFYSTSIMYAMGLNYDRFSLILIEMLLISEPNSVPCFCRWLLSIINYCRISCISCEVHTINILM